MVILALVIAILGIGIVTIVLAIINFALLFRKNVGTPPHIVFFLFYVALSIGVSRLAAETVNDFPSAPVQWTILLIPFLVVGHFFFLLSKFLKIRRAPRKPPELHT